MVQQRLVCKHLPPGLSLKDLEKILPELEYSLNAHVTLVQVNHRIYLEIHRQELPTKIPFTPVDLSGYHLGVPIGLSYNGPVILDLDDSTPSLIVAGVPGTGKSNFINQALAHITQNYGPEQVRLYLVDLKLGVELARWKDTSHTDTFVWDPKTAQLLMMLKKLYKELRKRMGLFREAGVYKIDEYNALGNSMPYLLLVIDEYAEVRRDPDVEEEIQSLLQIGRAGGLRCILSTQRPTADNISTSIKGLIATRLCFKVVDRVNSEVVLDVKGAESLPNIRGRGLLLHGAELREVQVQKAPK